jgi:hypothetical protein
MLTPRRRSCCVDTGNDARSLPPRGSETASRVGYDADFNDTFWPSDARTCGSSALWYGCRSAWLAAAAGQRGRSRRRRGAQLRRSDGVAG